MQHETIKKLFDVEWDGKMKKFKKLFKEVNLKNLI